MNRFSNVEEIKAYFVGDGWNKDISFHELTVGEAMEKGYSFAVSKILQNQKFFVMNDTGNVFDENGKIVVFNIAIGDNKDKPKRNNMNEKELDLIMSAIISSAVDTSKELQDKVYKILKREQKMPILQELYEHAKKSVKDFEGNDEAEKELKYWQGKRDAYKSSLNVLQG